MTSNVRMMEAERNAMESKTDTTKTSIIRSILEIKQQVLDERENNSKLQKELVEKTEEITNLKANIYRLSEEIKALDEIKDALTDAQDSLRQ